MRHQSRYACSFSGWLSERNDSNKRLLRRDTVTETRVYVEDWCTAENISADFNDDDDARTVTIERRAPYFVECPTGQDDVVVDDESKPKYSVTSEMLGTMAQNQKELLDEDGELIIVGTVIYDREMDVDSLEIVVQDATCQDKEDKDISYVGKVIIIRCTVKKVKTKKKKKK